MSTAVKYLITVVLIMAFASGASCESLLIDDFASLAAWSVCRDDGNIEISSGASAGSMRLVFTAGVYGWGNAQRDISLPPNATGIEFDLYVEQADSAISLFLWLMEADGDGHLSFVRPEGQSIERSVKKWLKIFVPISTFKYEPRGNKIPEILKTNRLLIGMCGGAGDVTVKNLKFFTKDASALQQPRTDGLKINRAAKGSVAILSDNFNNQPGDSSPEIIAEELASHGYGVTFLKSGDLSGPQILTADNFDILVLPYGPRYPQYAKDSIKAYLKSGGCFLSTGGYAFDEPCISNGRGFMVPSKDMTTAAELADNPSTSQSLNTRLGIPGDTMQLSPEQIGVFDPCYHLTNVSKIRVSGKEYPVKAEGYAACAVLGSNCPVFPQKWGKVIPLAEALDSLGRPRGPVGSLAYLFDGPYKGSAWSFFGVTNQDLFSKDGPMLPQISDIAGRLLARTFIKSVKTELAGYRAGEECRVTCETANLGKAARSVKLRVFVKNGGGKKIESFEQELNMAPGETKAVGYSFDVPQDWQGLYVVRAEIKEGNAEIDSSDTGFVVSSEKEIKSGFRLSYKDNYFYNSARPLLLSGVNETGAIFYSANENPLVWDRDLAEMRANGINVLRVLHFSPFVSQTASSSSTKPLDLNIDRLPLNTERKLDALVQLCQKHKVVLFLTIHDWMGIALSDEELAAQKKFAKLIAERYKDVPGFMIDVQNEPANHFGSSDTRNVSADVLREWHEFLKEKYGTDDVLRKAWNDDSVSLDTAKWERGTDKWDDIKTADADMFRNNVTNRWLKANRDGAKEGNPLVPVTVGFLQEYRWTNKLMCVDYMDFACMHSYNSLDVFRADLKLFDRRFEGKSVTVGEFGALGDHDKRTHGIDSKTQDTNRYLRTVHYSFGAGASLIANWCWKDMDDVIFPWGIKYVNDGPEKGLLLAYRNQSLLFRQVKPGYKSPEVFLVVPIELMTGGRFEEGMKLIYKYADEMMKACPDFGVIDDYHIRKLPSSAKLLIYPAPMRVPDAAYQKLLEFVESGGKVFVTGDISYDAVRERTLAQRLEELCGVKFISENYPNAEWKESFEPCANIEPEAAEKRGSIFINQLGSGQVYYSPGPWSELFKPLIASFRDNKETFSEGIHIYRINEENGARTYIVVNPGLSARACYMPGGVTVYLAPEGVGLARFDSKWQLLAVESQGDVTRNGTKLITGSGHFAVVSYDGKDITKSGSLAVIPFAPGEIELQFTDKGSKAALWDCAANRLFPADITGGRISISDETAYDPRLVAKDNASVEKLKTLVYRDLMLD